MKKTAKEQHRLIPAAEVFAEWQQDPAYREAYAALEDEFAIMAALVAARAAAGMTQEDVAKRMHTTQPAVARIEGGAHRASLKTLRGYAEATGHRVVIRLERVGKG
jgi:DNA-binding XRE family transcriptional regulator